MLANRFGVIRAFSDDDLNLFETLANNASVALQYDRLEQAVHQLRELQEQLHHQAFHDPLTDLANRIAVHQPREGGARLRLGRGRRPVHRPRRLQDLQRQLRPRAPATSCWSRSPTACATCVRPGDTIARLGGDEFAVMVHEREHAHETSVRRRRADHARVPGAGRGRDETISVHLSIGIATTPRQPRAADELIRNADLAMYQAKESGKGRFELFDLHMRDAVLKRHGLKEELQKAVERGEFVVEYQPIVAPRERRRRGRRGARALEPPRRGRLAARRSSSRWPRRPA